MDVQNRGRGGQSHFWVMSERKTVFKASALWADAFYKSKYPSVCPCVCPCVCLCVHFWGTVLTSFCPHFPKSDVQYFKRFGILGGKYGKKWSQIGTFLFENCQKSPRNFHQLGPLGRVGLVVDTSVCLCVCLFVPFPCNFFRGLSLVLRSHDQIPASHWSTLLSYLFLVTSPTGKYILYFQLPDPSGTLQNNF